MLEVGDVIEFDTCFKDGSKERGFVTEVSRKTFRFMYQGASMDTWDLLDAVGRVYRVMTDEEVFLPAIGSKWRRSNPLANAKPVEIVGYDFEESTIDYKTTAGTGFGYLRWDIDAFLKEYEPC